MHGGDGCTYSTGAASKVLYVVMGIYFNTRPVAATSCCKGKFALWPSSPEWEGYGGDGSIQILYIRQETCSQFCGFSGLLACVEFKSLCTNYLLHGSACVSTT